MNINHEQEIIITLQDFIKNVKNQDKIVTLESHLINDLDIDSLDVVEIGFLVEKKYKYHVDMDAIFSAQILFVHELVEFFKSRTDDSKI